MLPDNFAGDDLHLVDCIDSLLKMDAAGVLVPHGVGGHARTLLSAAGARLHSAALDRLANKSTNRPAWPMLEQRHLEAVIFAYNEGYSKAYDGRVFPNPFAESASQAAAWEAGTRDGNRTRVRDMAIAKQPDGSFETLIAVLAALGYTAQFMEAHPELKASAGVAQFMDERNARIKDAWIQSICSAGNLTHGRASGIVEAMWATIEATETA